ncbi:hypothetical protein HDV02_002272 [Globomyces sp. JEL0801]|nr:hypothetical protein HDV02_002272 [Globomyces sp. JEL0801]
MSDYRQDSYGRDERRRRDDDDYPRRQRSYSPRRRSDDIDPLKDDIMMDLRDFAHYTREKNQRQGKPPLEQDEVERRYDVYRITFTKTQNDKLFKSHFQDEWFKEKYHPELSGPFHNQIYQRKKEVLEQFEIDLNDGKFDAVSFDEVEKDVNGGPPQHSNEEENQNQNDQPMEESQVVPFLLDPIKPYSLFIKGISSSIKREDILELCKTIPGFKYLELTDPRPDKRMSRLGWIVLENGSDLDAALAKVDGQQIGESYLGVAIQREMTFSARSFSAHSEKPSRLQYDATQIKELAKLLDKEAGIDEDHGCFLIEKRLQEIILPTIPPTEDSNEMDEEDKGIQTASIKKQLDYYILYLYLVHFYDYYSGVESTCPEDHSRRGALPSRKPLSTLREMSSKVFWLSKLDSRVKLRMGQYNLPDAMVTFGFKDVELEQDKVVSLYIRKESESKYRCTECQKLFRGDDFVRKHIKSKHEQVISQVAIETEYFNNFCKDFNKLEMKSFQNTSTNRERNNGNYRPDYRDRNYERRGREGPRNERRSIKSYHDLDAPVGGEIQLSYD